MLDDPKKLLELRMWASNRGQTLYRTVRGIMQYERALQLICNLQGVADIETEEILRGYYYYYHCYYCYCYYYYYFDLQPARRGRHRDGRDSSRCPRHPSSSLITIHCRPSFIIGF